MPSLTQNRVNGLKKRITGQWCSHWLTRLRTASQLGKGGYSTGPVAWSWYNPPSVPFRRTSQWPWSLLLGRWRPSKNSFEAGWPRYPQLTLKWHGPPYALAIVCENRSQRTWSGFKFTNGPRWRVFLLPPSRSWWATAGKALFWSDNWLDGCSI